MRYYRFTPELDGFLDTNKTYPPNHSSLTMVQPPDAQVGFVRVFDRDEQDWFQVEDHRGETVYRTADGGEYVITELGPISEDYTTEARPSEWHEWASGKWLENTEAKEAFEAEAQRQADFRAEPDRVALLDKLKTATPAQINTWVDDNLTSLAGARTVIKALVKVVALDARNGS